MMMTDHRTQSINHIVGSLSTWKTTGIEPSRHGQEDKNVQLDILARILLTWPNDTCIALCLWDGKLLVASNREVPNKLIKEDLDKWKKFIQFENSRLKLRLDLLKDALKRSYNVIEKSDLVSILRDRILGSEDKKKLKEFEELSDKQRRTAREERIVHLVQELFKLSKVLKEGGNISLANKIWDFISPIEDSNKIMKFIHEGKLDLSLSRAIVNDDVIPVISEENIHAEMKIVDYIFGLAKKTAGKYFCIGIGKLCCLPCQKVIDVVNWSNRFRIGVPGTHGKTYNWKLLKSFRDNDEYDGDYNRFKEELERIKDGRYAQYVRESTCYFPKNLTSFVFEESFIAQQEQQT